MSNTTDALREGAAAPASPAGANDGAAGVDNVTLVLRGPDGQIKTEVTA